MKKTTRLTFACALGALAATAAATAASPRGTAATHRAAVAAERERIGGLMARRAAPAGKAASAAKAAPAGVDVVNPTPNPGTPIANPFRAYPPSCAADPVPDVVSGPVVSASLPLFATDGSADPNDPNSAGQETVTVSVWRVACSSSGATTPYSTGGQNALTLLRIDRAAQNDGNQSFFPTMPQFLISQGGVDFSADNSVVRVAAEPNTVISEVPFDAPVYQSTTYVLENYPINSDYVHNYNQAFDLQINPALVDGNCATDGNGCVTLQVPAYAPDSSTYPAAFAPRPLDGYAAAQWTNADRAEGLLVQVSEQYDAQGAFTRQAVFDLLTKDANGNPFWLVGNAAFPIGATRLDVDIAYLGNQNQQVPWGRATLQLASCNELDIAFTPNAGLAAPVPVFSGTIAYNRLFSENGMTCE